MRIRTAHFPPVKTLEDFNLDHLPSLRRDVLAHLATGTFVAKAENVILLGPPGTREDPPGDRARRSRPPRPATRSLFDTASNWITRLADAHHAGRLETELKKIRRYRLIIIDEVGYIPFDHGRREPVLPAHRLPLRSRARSWSPRTCPSGAGARPSATTSSPPR